MSYQKRMEARRKEAASKSANRDQTEAIASSPNQLDASMQRAMREAAAGKYQKAVEILLAAGKEPVHRNAIGVCLMRLGKFEDAIRIFREFVLKPGCSFVRPELPDVYKINFAQALLLGGHPAGCLDILDEIRDPQNPAVQRVRTSVKQWEKSLSFLQRLSWRFGRIEPDSRPVNIGFPPGEFGKGLDELPPD